MGFIPIMMQLYAFRLPNIINPLYIQQITEETFRPIKNVTLTCVEIIILVFYVRNLY
jgi:hypothetical protein